MREERKCVLPSSAVSKAHPRLTPRTSRLLLSPLLRHASLSKRCSQPEVNSRLLTKAFINFHPSYQCQNFFMISQKAYRFYEILPGAVTWSILLMPFAFSFLWPVGMAYFIIVFDVYWLVKALVMG